MKTVLITTLFAASAALGHAAEPTVEFSRDVRPILSDACFHCHGFDEETRKAKLRLDTKAGLFTERDGVTPVVAGDLSKSEILTRISSDDKDEVMPPPKHPRQLTKEQKETLKLWVQQGAPFEDKHWSFTSIVPPPVPKVAQEKWARQPLDHFVLAEMEKHGLKPSAEANRATLIRRVSLDLTGLPPTPEDVAAFEKDKSPQAYENLVDRLLKSPRYGERMAVDWLDLARYADTAGFQVDPERTMWPWRDWVVRAYNDNLPFDQFTIWQIAGDLLPNATHDQLTATGFNRNHRMNGEAGSIEAEWHVENIVDRVDTTSTAWLGLTMGCARCHDHKYDPLTQRDFYSMFAFFNNVDERGLFSAAGAKKHETGKPWLLLPDAAQERQKSVLEKKLAAAQAAQNQAARAAAPAQAEWEKTALTHEANWVPLDKIEVRSEGGVTLNVRADGSVLAKGTGKVPASDTYRVKGLLPLANVTAVRLELLPDDSLPRKGPGLHRSGNCLLSGFDALFDGDDTRQRIAAATATFAQDNYPIAPVGEGRKFGRTVGWGIAPQTGRAQSAVFELKSPLKNAAGKPLEVVLEQEIGNGSLIGCFRVSATSDLAAGVLPPDVASALTSAADKRSPRQSQVIRQAYLKTVPAYVEAGRNVERAQASLDILGQKIPAVMVMNEAKQRDTFMLMRGAYDKPGDEVEAAVPAILPPLPEGAPANRLSLARWLVSTDNPLTARVSANRLWAMVFGRGIVPSLENFGVQGDWPTNRPLLDWLAAEFMKTWDTKAFLKMLVTSAAYQQQSIVTPELLEKDPENRYLARGPRYRLSAEMIRDQALAVSGLLHEQRGGPPVKPYQPGGLWEELAASATSARAKLYTPSTGTDLYRRSVYTYWKRTIAPTTMSTFDAPTREICTVKRSRTCTPLQALALMNDVTYLEAARALGERLLNDKSATPQQRIANAFHLVLARAPRPQELTKLTAALASYEAHFRADAEAARQLITQGSSKPDAALDPATLAAHTMLASLMLNLDETVTKQ